MTYPFWGVVAPSGAFDPPIVWWLVGATFVVGGLLGLTREPRDSARFLLLPMFITTAHLNLLFALNPNTPFYAVAAVVQVFSAALLMQDSRIFLVYAVYTLLLSGVPFVLGAQPRALFHTGGLASVLYLANRHFRAERVAWRRVGADLEEARTRLAEEKAERARLEEELQVAQRMDSLGRLAGAFSHEFNNQLMAIRIHAELLEQALPKGSGLRADLERIQATTSAAADLTSRLLAFSRVSRAREEPADLCRVVRDSVVTLRHLMTESTSVASRLPEGSCVVPVGAKQLNQIILNLALNSRDAMPSGGTLRLEVSRLARGEVELPIEVPSERLVVLSVVDAGVGIDAEARSKIFEPFFTTKGERGNSGLGLSVVYGIVKETGGHVRVSSEPGKGARFDLYWPEIEAAPREAEALYAEATRQASRRGRVLLVEDQPVLREGLTRWLADRGFAVVPCESGEEALVAAKDVDVIASDVVLSGMDGIELLGRLRARAPWLPAVLFSGHLDHLAAERRQVPVGVPVLEKPFAPEALVETIDELIESARANTG